MSRVRTCDGGSEHGGGGSLVVHGGDGDVVLRLGDQAGQLQRGDVTVHLHLQATVTGQNRVQKAAALLRDLDLQNLKRFNQNRDPEESGGETVFI